MTPFFLKIWQALGYLPLLPYRIVAGVLSVVFGLLIMAFGADRRKVLWTNLGLCFPHTPASQKLIWAAQHVYFYLRTFFDRAWLWQGSEALLRDRVIVTNPQVLEQLKRSDQKIVFLAPHFLGLDAAWSRLCLDLNMVTMYSNQKNEALDRVILAGRSAYGDPLLHSRLEGVRPLLQSMKKGRPLYYLPDMDFGEKESVFVEFFGVQAATVTAVGRISKMMKAQVVPVTTRFSRGRYYVTLRNPIDPFPLDDEILSAREINRCIECWITENISQYLWTHKRFKTRPPGQKKYY